MKHPVDVHVGKRVRHRRWMVGMTQQQLGDIVGIKFQQIQKYETGMNRISASRLWDIAQALDVSISFFFEGFESDAGDAAMPTAIPERGDLLADKEALRTGAFLLCDPRGAASSAIRPRARPQRRSLTKQRVRPRPLLLSSRRRPSGRAGPGRTPGRHRSAARPVPGLPDPP